MDAPQVMTREGWLTDEERQQVFDTALIEAQHLADEMEKRFLDYQLEPPDYPGMWK